MLKHRFIIFTLIILLITNLAVISNITFLREISVFLFLTVIPGFLFLRILNIKNLDIWEKIILTVGISISITIFLGLFTNYFFILFNAKPLTTINLLLSFDFLIAVFLIVLLLIKPDKMELSPHNPLGSFLRKLNSYDKFALILSAIILTLSVLGSITYFNSINIVFMIMILGLITYMVLFYKKINSNILPFTILSISLSILLAYSLFSPYIYGSDSNNEFHFFKLVLYNSKWTIFESSILDSSISISILPAIYQILSNLNQIYAFKLALIIPLSLNPLIIYLITRKYVGNDIFAFLAAAFIISQSTFFSQISAYRNYIAIFFFALVIMIMLRDKLDSKWAILYVIFLFSAIVSHYSTAYMLFAILFASFIIVKLITLFLNIKRKDKIKYKQNFLKDKNYLTIGIIVLIFAFIFLWHGQIADQSFDHGFSIISRTISNLINFSFMDSNTPITAASGGTLKNAPLSTYINFLVYWISIILIIIGVLVYLIRYLKKPNSSIVKLNFLGLSLSSISIFGLMLFLPGIFKSLSAGRVYAQILVILACFFVLGGIILTKAVKIKKSHLFILLIVIASFSTSSGLISQYGGNPNSILFNSPQELNDTFYIGDTEAYSADWFKNYYNEGNIYADTTASYRLIGIGMIPFSKIDRLSLLNNKNLGKGYLYLVHSNTIKSQYYFWRSEWEIYNMSELQYKYENKNLIYTSGDSEIWN